MRNLTAFVATLALITACKGKDADHAAGTDPAPSAAKPTAAPAGDPASAPSAAPPAPAPAAPAAAGTLTDLDLSGFGPAFKGYVASVPDGAKLEFSDPSRFIHLSDTDYVSISEAPFWEDGVGGLAKDPDNKNIKKISATEYRYERTPPLGTAWAVDVLVKVGATKFSCTAGDPGTFTSADRRDQISAICNSIRKK